MTDERGLTDALHRRADQLGHTHPISLEDVQGRARGIRRRRVAISGLAAATVLGVTAPFALSIGDDATSPDRTPDVAATKPASTGVKDGVLTTDVDEAGGKPGIPYLYGGEVHLPDGSTVPIDGNWTSFDTLGDGFVVSDGTRLAVLDADGGLVLEQPSDGPVFAVSADHSLVAHVTGGQVEALQADGGAFSTPVPDMIQTPQLVGVTGSGSCDPEQSETGGCVFYLNDAGEKPRGYSLTSKGIANPLARFLQLSDVSSDGWVSGVTEIDDMAPSSCSDVMESAFDEKAVWSTCDVTVGAFDADTKLVLGHPTYRDGMGDGSLALLDAKDGTVLADWQNSEQHQAWAGSTAWDTDGTALGVVQEGGEWSLMRFAPDGGLSKVMDLEGGDETTPPLVLPEGS